MKGSVTLVGAGPGDVGLLTLNGAQALREAEVVVYDRLVSSAILALIPPQAARINVGKQAGNHPVPQEEINRILLAQALAGKRVVRLKGGDPFVFGRGGEELELLRENGVPFSVVPGVTSALSVPAYAGIPVTHRDCCSSVHIITGHARAGAPLSIDFEALCRTGGTLVFLMGVSTLPEICRGLLRAGMAADTPAAVIEQGTLPAQRKCVCTLETLWQQAEAMQLKSPAITVVGRVCALSTGFDWFDSLPMKGRRVIVTRPEGRQGVLCSRLRALGADVMEYPCIRIVPRAHAPELDDAIQTLDQFRWLVFTSPAGPELFFRRLRAAGKDARALAGVKLAAIGPKTAQAMQAYGLYADLVPEVYDSSHLAAAMQTVCGPVLLCRASQASAALPEMFQKNGVSFVDAACYDTIYESPDAEAARRWLQLPVLVSFTSASTVRGFVKSLPGADFSQVLGCCIGAQTAQEAARHGIQTVVANEATIESLIECMKEVQ